MPRRRHRPVVAIVAVGIALLLGPACSSATSTEEAGIGPGTTAAPPPVRGGALVVATSGEPDGMNPITSQWNGPGYHLARAVLDPLVVMDVDGQWQPYLAKAITANADFTVWTIELRPGITFHNGEVLDSRSLAAFLEAVAASPLTSQGFPVKPTVEPAGELTVTLTFTEPWSAMPNTLAAQAGYVIAPAQLESGDSSEPIGTGPFVFEQWTKGESFSARRNPDYWRDGLPYLDEIEFRPITDPGSRESALRSSAVDMTELYTPTQSTLDDLRSASYTVIDDVDRAGVTNLLMNTGRGALRERDVREAIVSAIDREAFRDVVLDASYEVADQPFPADSQWHADVDYPTFDPDRARELVSAHEAANGPITITIMLVAGGPAAAPQFIEQQLEAVGIDAQIDELEVTAYTQRFVTGNFDTALLGGFFFAQDPDPSTMFLTSKNADPDSAIKLNFTELRSDEIDAALEAQRRTDDVAARQAEWAKIWNVLAAELPYAFLVYQRFALVTNPDVYGLTGFTAPDGAPLPPINHWTTFYTGVYVAGG